MWFTNLLQSRLLFKVRDVNCASQANLRYVVARSSRTNLHIKLCIRFDGLNFSLLRDS